MDQVGAREMQVLRSLLVINHPPTDHRNMACLAEQVRPHSNWTRDDEGEPSPPLEFCLSALKSIIGRRRPGNSHQILQPPIALANLIWLLCRHRSRNHRLIVIRARWLIRRRAPAWRATLCACQSSGLLYEFDWIPSRVASLMTTGGLLRRSRTEAMDKIVVRIVIKNPQLGGQFSEKY